MTKKNLMLMFFAVALLAVYAIWFSDWFQTTPLRISHTTRNMERFAGVEGNALPGLRFRVNPAVHFTDLKVVPVAELETNQNPVPVWHLVGDKGSQRVDEFSYGMEIPGMRPAIAGTHADALDTNVTYRLFIIAGKARGQHDFELK